VIRGLLALLIVVQLFGLAFAPGDAGSALPLAYTLPEAGHATSARRRRWPSGRAARSARDR